MSKYDVTNCYHLFVYFEALRPATAGCNPLNSRLKSRRTGGSGPGGEDR